MNPNSFLVLFSDPDDPSLGPLAAVVSKPGLLPRDFKHAYRLAYDATRKANPENWNLGDVLDVLRAEGWEIETPQPLATVYNAFDADLFAASYSSFDQAGRALGVDATELASKLDLAALIRVAQHGQRIAEGCRALTNGGSFDLTDSPLSFMDNVKDGVKGYDYEAARAVLAGLPRA